jgi:hypothetical protein
MGAAIKVLLPAVANDLERLARFGREAQVLAPTSRRNGFLKLIEAPLTAARAT